MKTLPVTDHAERSFVVPSGTLTMKKNRLRNNEAGAALLAIMLIVVVSASALLLSRLNDNVQQYVRESSSVDVLGQAKAALIGYAVKYPENHPGQPPGVLPCPDTDNDGSAVSNCTGGTMGRLPWKTLEISELRDHQGERLWYTLADNYRTPLPTTLNSDTAANLTLDANTDIVAVIFAPGAPVDGQDRTGSGTTAVANYLEDNNADGDVNFVSRATGEFNDRVVYITRQELMKVIEKRVMGEARKALLSYRSSHNAFPWLSPFEDPSTSAFKAQPNTWEGHLPYHWSGDMPGGSNRNPFDTSLRWIWNIDTGTASTSSWGTVTDDCLRNVDCSDALFPTITSVNTPSIDCVWSDIDPNDSKGPKDAADCERSNFILMSSTPCTFCDTGTCYRFYQMDFPAYSGDSTINDPSSSGPRTRDVVLSGSLVPQDDAVEITDVYIASTSSCASNVVGRGSLDFTPGTTGSIGTHDLQYDIDIDAGELPEWFVNNDWHELVYIAYSDAEDPPGGATVCTPGTDCLTLDGVNGTNDDKRAMAVVAGRDFNGNRPTGSMADYFEGENSDECASGCAAAPFDKTLLKDTVTASFNDQLRVILEAP